MGRLWCDGFPTVTVPRTETPKPVTLIVPYYDNRAFFGAQVTRWATYPEPLLKWLSVIVVDDGSPRYPAVDVLRRHHWPACLRLFRLEVDVRWNWLAARNIGFHHAADGWCLVTDMDHVVTTDTLHAVVYSQHDPAIVYAFARREHTGPAVTPHSASFLMTRQTFWRIGGYDEALSGHYGTDGVYRREIVKHARIHLLPEALVRYEYVDDSSTSTYKRKQPEDAAVRKLVAARTPHWKPKVLSFPYHEEVRAA